MTGRRKTTLVPILYRMYWTIPGYFNRSTLANLCIFPVSQSHNRKHNAKNNTDTGESQVSKQPSE